MQLDYEVKTYPSTLQVSQLGGIWIAAKNNTDKSIDLKELQIQIPLGKTATSLVKSSDASTINCTSPAPQQETDWSVKKRNNVITLQSSNEKNVTIPKNGYFSIYVTMKINDTLSKMHDSKITITEVTDKERAHDYSVGKKKLQEYSLSNFVVITKDGNESPSSVSAGTRVFLQWDITPPPTPASQFKLILIYTDYDGTFKNIDVTTGPSYYPREGSEDFAEGIPIGTKDGNMSPYILYLQPQYYLGSEHITPAQAIRYLNVSYPGIIGDIAIAPSSILQGDQVKIAWTTNSSTDYDYCALFRTGSTTPIPGAEKLKPESGKISYLDTPDHSTRYTVKFYNNNSQEEWNSANSVEKIVVYSLQPFHTTLLHDDTSFAAIINPPNSDFFYASTTWIQNSSIHPALLQIYKSGAIEYPLKKQPHTITAMATDDTGKTLYLGTGNGSIHTLQGKPVYEHERNSSSNEPLKQIISLAYYTVGGCPALVSIDSDNTIKRYIYKKNKWTAAPLTIHRNERFRYLIRDPSSSNQLYVIRGHNPPYSKDIFIINKDTINLGKGFEGKNDLQKFTINQNKVFCITDTENLVYMGLMNEIQILNSIKPTPWIDIAIDNEYAYLLTVDSIYIINISSRYFFKLQISPAPTKHHWTFTKQIAITADGKLLYAVIGNNIYCFKKKETSPNPVSALHPLSIAPNIVSDISVNDTDSHRNHHNAREERFTTSTTTCTSLFSFFSCFCTKSNKSIEPSISHEDTTHNNRSGIFHFRDRHRNSTIYPIPYSGMAKLD